jgi:hypothetical protein
MSSREGIRDLRLALQEMNTKYNETLGLKQEIKDIKNALNLVPVPKESEIKQMLQTAVHDIVLR